MSSINNLNKSIYVGHISKSIDEEMLTNIFGQSNIGTIKSINLRQSKNPRKHFQYAIITYKTHDQAEKAINDMNSQIIDGFPVQVQYFENKAKNNNKDSHFNGGITVKNVSSSAEPDEVIHRFEKYGKIDSFKVLKDKELVFIHYDNNDDAIKAISEMNGRYIKGHKITVSKQYKFNYTDLHIKSGLPFQIKTKEDLQNWLDDIFTDKGDEISSNITKLRLLLHPDDSEFREAIITFSNPKILKNAMYILKLHEVKCYPESANQVQNQLNKNMACWNINKNEKYSRSIYVRNFPENFNEKKLERLFWTFKDFKKVVLKSSINNSKYAFVSFISNKGVIKAVEKSCLIYFQDENNKKKVNQLFTSYRRKNKDEIDHSKINDFRNEIIKKYGYKSFNFRLFKQMSVYQKLCLIENEKLFKKWEEKCNELEESVKDDDNNDVVEEEEENEQKEEEEENDEGNDLNDDDEENDESEDEDNDYDDNSDIFDDDDDF